MQPVVTCIMPVLARRSQFLASAIRRWATGQRGLETELLVVTDPGELDAIRAAVPERPGIRVIQCDSRILGRKYEAGIHQAAGAYCAKWDDDDWYGPTRLARQVEPLALGNADIVSLREHYAVLIPDGTFWVSNHTHRHAYHDGTLVVRKDCLKYASFGNCSLGESAIFVRKACKAGARHVTIDAGEDFVYVRHSCNAWRFEISKHFSGPVPKPPWFPDADLAEMKAIPLPVAPPQIPVVARRIVRRLTPQPFVQSPVPRVPCAHCSPAQS
jgi:hypothetical protein